MGDREERRLEGEEVSKGVEGGFFGEIHAAILRQRKLEHARDGTIGLDPLPEESCGRTADGNDRCSLVEGHEGPCNIGEVEG